MLVYRHVVAILYTILLFIDRLDLTIVNVALPTLAQRWGVGLEDINLVSLSFLLALVIFLPVSGWLGNRWGTRRVFLGALALFGVFGTLCVFAPHLKTLIIFRFFQGIGSGILMPLGMALLYRAYDKSEYASVTSFTFMPSLLAPAIAPLLGGLLLDYVGWRSIFCCSGPIALCVFVVAFIWLRDEEERETGPFDWWGFISSTGFLFLFFISLSRFSSYGIDGLGILGLLASCLLAIIFVVVEKRAFAPLINLDIFKNDLFFRVNLIQICFQICHFGSIFLMGIYLQIGLGFSPSESGVMMGMQAVGAIFITRFSVRLFNTYDPKSPIILGFLGMAMTTPCILWLHPSSSLLLGSSLFFIRGLFSGLCGAPIQTLGMVGFPIKMLGQATSVFNISRQIAISLGVVMSSLLCELGFYLTNTSMLEKPPLQHPVFVFGASFCAVSLVCGLGIFLVYTLPRLAPLLTQLEKKGVTAVP